MDKLLTPDDVAVILQVSRRTAYTIMHQIQHLEKPFRVSEAGLRVWLAEHTKQPEDRSTARNKPGCFSSRGQSTARGAMNAGKRSTSRTGNGKMPLLGYDYHIPRRREERGGI